MQTRRWRIRAVGTLSLLLLLLAAYCAWALLRPLPAIQPDVHASSSPTNAPPAQLNWPAQGQAAVTLANSSIIETHGPQTPAPTASTAKVITTLMVLQKHPLAAGETGPTITITPDDVARYQNYISKDGSILPVQAGEQLSEYQMLQAILLPSANNIADTLAIWAYGSLPAYAQAANSFLQQHGFKGTHVGSDASGLSPDTTTTAQDLVGLGKLLLANPVLAQIVAQPSADGFPVAGTIKNVNFLLGSSGIVGIKTGNSDQAGGVFLSAAKTTVADHSVTVLTAIVGAPTLEAALSSSLPLVQSAENNFASVTAFKANQVLATYRAPWGATTQIVAPHNLNATTWRGSSLSTDIQAPAIKPGIPAPTATAAAKSTFGITQENLTFSRPLLTPAWRWRLLHPLPSQ